MAAIQFTGLASGLDTDSMVQAMLLTQQNKIDNVKEDKEILKWKKDEWTKVNELVNNFYKNYVQKLQKQSTFYSYTTSVSCDAVSTATSGSMSEGIHTFSDIELAEGVLKTGTLDEKITSTGKSFKELGVMTDGEKHIIKVDTKDQDGNDVTKEIEILSTDTVDTLESKLEQAESNLRLNFDLKNGKVFISTKETGVNSKLNITFDDCDVFKKLGLTGKLADKNGNEVANKITWDFYEERKGLLGEKITSTTQSFKELGVMADEETHIIKVDTKDRDGKNITKEIKILSTDTVATLKGKLEQAESNLKLNFDLENGKVFISTKEIGTNSKLDITFDDCDVFKQLGLTGNLTDKDGNEVANKTTWDLYGKGASYKYNGISYTSESNNIEVNGVKVTLERNTMTGEEVTVKVKSDSDALVSFMKEFVDEYNKLIEELNKKYDATKVSTKLLTDTEKQKKTDKQIDEYEQNIKDSLLRRDESLGKIISTLRDSMQTIFSNGKYQSLSAVGITTGSYSENGKLIFDEKGQEKFRQCVENNLEDVIKLFTAVNSSTKEDKNAKSEGIGTKLYKNITLLRKRVEGLKSYESYYNDKLTADELKSYDSRLKELQKKYSSMETMYKRKFSAMEKALSQINSQSASFMSMLPS